MKKVLFHPDASQELTAASKWYEKKQRDLGKRFLASVQDAVLQVQINPLLYPEIMPDIRRILTTHFPFSVVYNNTGTVIIVYAIMHLRRNPGYWKDRLTG